MKNLIQQSFCLTGFFDELFQYSVLRRFLTKVYGDFGKRKLEGRRIRERERERMN